MYKCVNLYKKLSNVKRLSLFAMHSSEKNVPENEVVYINFLLEISDIIIILTTNNCHEEDYHIFPPNVIILTCRNEGNDFGLWQQFFQEFSFLNFKNIEELILANDSCYCIRTLKKIYEKNLFKSFWGFTDSHDKLDHIQSYFLSFNSRNVIKKVFEFFEMNDFTKLNDKNDIVFYGEIGISQYFIENNIPFYAEYAFDNLKKDSECLNSSYSFWKELRRLGCPLIKKKRK
jgi:lipopolysaccharide biosynthesis protein